MAESIDIKSLRVVDLRKELEKRNLSKTGKKDELVARLEEALLQEEKVEEETNNNEGEQKAEEGVEEEEKLIEKEQNKEEDNNNNNSNNNNDNNKEKDTQSVDKKNEQQISHIEELPIQVEEEKEKSDNNNDNMDKDKEIIEPQQQQKETEKVEEKVEEIIKETTEKDITAKDIPISPTKEETKVVDSVVDKMDEDQVNKRKREEEVTENDQEKRAKLETDSESTKKNESTKDNKETTTITNIGHENEEQTAICIKNLVRPLISRDVRVLVGNHGEIQRFFIDNVKTHCYVIYENVKEADDALKNIDGIKFPPETGKNVSVLKLYPSQVEQLIKREQELESQGITRTPWEKFLNNLLENKDIDEGLNNNDNDSSNPTRRRMGALEQITKQLNQRTAISIIGQAKERKSRSILDRLSSTQAPPPPKVPVGKSLDELFLKTKVTPALYYLPVEESIATERLAALKRK